MSLAPMMVDTLSASWLVMPPLATLLVLAESPAMRMLPA